MDDDPYIVDVLRLESARSFCQERIAYLDKVDWTCVNLDEWLGILAQTGHLPTAENAASMLSLDQLTGSGSRLNPKKSSATANNR